MKAYKKWICSSVGSGKSSLMFKLKFEIGAGQGVKWAYV